MSDSLPEARLCECDGFPREFWRHERFGAYRFAKLVCLVLGHDYETWEAGVDIDGTVVADEDACEFVTMRGDCRRCWA